ncbi:hypothetical protein [Paraglaciecola sp.]|uniref:hypothetical protein n=1 Tax=Paraglaciecola sp. TaxID=1920173 RepID=UPI0030F3D359
MLSHHPHTLFGLGQLHISFLWTIGFGSYAGTFVLLTFSLAKQRNIHTAAKLAAVAGFASVLIVGMNNMGEGFVDIMTNTLTGVRGLMLYCFGASTGYATIKLTKFKALEY